MKSLNNVKWIFFLFISSISCTKIKVPVETERALQMAGNNRSELEKVIKHYSATKDDTLKLKAAYFLLNGMQGMYYYEGELLDHYYHYFELIKRDVDNGLYVEESLKSSYGRFDKERLIKKYDLENITANQLIGNIDMAFKVWREQPWGKHISFDQFCEYILPFRIGDEIPAYNRKEIYEKFNPLLDSIRKVNGSALAACKAINDRLIADKWLFTTRMGYLPHVTANVLIKYRVGTCQEMADMACYIMRAVGIPVANEFLLQWPQRSGRHNWNSVLDSNGKMIIFLGAEDSPPDEHKCGNKKGKIFRRTYLPNPISLAAIKKGNEEIPECLNDAHIKDVSDEYLSCANFSIPLKTPTLGKRFAYLNVFNDKNWVPVDWGWIKNNQAFFKKMETGLLYLPTFLGDDIDGEALNYPFILDETRRVHYIIPDSLKTMDLLINEKSPILADWFQGGLIRGGKFQGANKADFSDAVTLYHITEKPKPFFNELLLNTNKAFRYLRYLSPIGNLATIGQINCFSSATDTLKGTFISKGGYHILYKLNHNPLTRRTLLGGYGSVYRNSGWVGFDWGFPKLIKRIEYSGRVNSCNPTFINGDLYILYFWNKNQWKNIDKQLVVNGGLHFKHVPQNALYRFRNVTERDPVIRVFTYENGRQIWW